MNSFRGCEIGAAPRREALGPRLPDGAGGVADTGRPPDEEEPGPGLRLDGTTEEQGAGVVDGRK